jgi:hypothetical protein
VEASQHAKRQLDESRAQCDTLLTKVRELEQLGGQKGQLLTEVSKQLAELEARNAALRREHESGGVAHSLNAQHQAELRALTAEMGVMQGRIELLASENEVLKAQAARSNSSSSSGGRNSNGTSLPEAVAAVHKHGDDQLRRRSQVFQSQVRRVAAAAAALLLLLLV